MINYLIKKNRNNKRIKNKSKNKKKNHNLLRKIKEYLK